MNLQELRDLLRRPAWSKDVVVWTGSRDTLDHELHGLRQQVLDLLSLLPDAESLPAAADDRAELLDAELQKRKQESKGNRGRESPRHDIAEMEIAVQIECNNQFVPSPRITPHGLRP